MMDYLRKAITGLQTSRFKNEGFDLDLTYVTDRIVAMSFPGSGWETIYRNAIGDVAKLLNKQHGSNYLVMNLSGQKYNYAKFNFNVEDFGWEDHHSPPLSLVFQACARMHEYLSADPRNVVVVHCMAGKGRTGTLIVCYLLYTGRFENSEEALTYYKNKRFVEGGGVTQPSQIRTVQYFEQAFNSYVGLNKMMVPRIAKIERIVIHGTPQVGAHFRPKIKIISVQFNQVIYNSEETKGFEIATKDGSKHELILGTSNPFLAGDIMIKFSHDSAFSASKKLFRYAFNTSFLPTNEENKSLIRLDLNKLDPHEIKQDKRFPLSFTVDTYFDVYTDKPEMEQSEVPKSNASFDEDQLSWNAIYEILEKYKPPSKEASVKLLFTDVERDDVDKVLGRMKKDARRALTETDFDLIEEY